MTDITAEQLLARLGMPINKSIPPDYIEYSLDEEDDKEYVFNNPAEMYSNSELKKKKNKKKNTFQQSMTDKPSNFVNVRGQATASFSPPSATSEEVREEAIPERSYGRRLNWQTDKIVEMRLQIGNIRVGKRYIRSTAYMSIKTEDDTRYMIFMRSDMTTALDETYRSIKKDNDKVLQTVADDFYTEHGLHKLSLGRVKYKVVRGQKIQKHHRANLPVALVGMWQEDGQMKARFHLLGEDYDFKLSDDLSESQKRFYTYEGLWQLDEGTMSMNEAFGG